MYNAKLWITGERTGGIKGQPPGDLLLEFDTALGEAQDEAGYRIEGAALTRELVKRCGLSAEELRWATLEVQGYLSQHERIRRNIRRLPHVFQEARRPSML